jgi:rod shape-determining protein MreC
MAWTSTIFHKNRRSLSFILAAIIFLLVTISGSEFRPFLGNLSSTLIYSPFFKLKNYIEGLRNVSEENQSLKNQMAQLVLQLGQFREIKRENQRLKEMIGYEPTENFDLIPVKIISILYDFRPLAATINKGESEGIRVNQPVVNRFGLVGKVKEVMSHSAVVQLLTDPAGAVSGRIAESRQIGVVKYSMTRGLILEDLPADAEIKKGDLIISSGLGGIYPPGIPVAIVDSVYPNEVDILKKVDLMSTVDFYKIDEMYILLRGR